MRTRAKLDIHRNVNHILMPEANYHEEKRDRFRTTADFLSSVSKRHHIPSYDANVQDYFYAMIHETERYLKGAFDFDSGGHGRKEARINNWTVIRSSHPRNRIIRKATFYQNPGRYGSTIPVLDNRSLNYYMWLNSLRKDLVYGETIISSRRHASSDHVTRARQIFLAFCRSLASHIGQLRTNGFI